MDEKERIEKYGSILFGAEEIGLNGVEYLRNRRENKQIGIPFGLKSMDELDADGNVWLPEMPGELTGYIARPGNGKSSLMVNRARRRAQDLQSRGIADRVVVYLTYEQTVEELYAFHLAAELSERASKVDADGNEIDPHLRLSVTDMARGVISNEQWREILLLGSRRRFLPLWNIGYSAVKTAKPVYMDSEAVAGALELIEDRYHLKIDFLFVDYLQRMPYRFRESKTVGVSENLDILKNFAFRFRCPVGVGIQSRREVDEQEPPIPHDDDGQWTSNVEQTCDRLVSLVRPRKYRQVGEMFGSMRVEGNNQMLISVLKQRLGPSNYAKWVSLNPLYNRLDELEVRNERHF